MADLSKYKQFENNLKYFVGYATEVTLCACQSGTVYCTFSIPLKKKKDDEPLWLNCKVFGNELASKLESEVKKGSKVLVGGFFKTTQSEEREYLNFIVMNYTVLQDPVSRGETYDS